MRSAKQHCSERTSTWSWPADFATFSAPLQWSENWYQSPELYPFLPECDDNIPFDSTAMLAVSNDTMPLGPIHLDNDNQPFTTETGLAGSIDDAAGDEDDVISPACSSGHSQSSEAEELQPGSVVDSDVQPFSPLTCHSMSTSNQRALVKRGLLKVYHDSLEGALSCWLTERNCPYVVSAFDSQEAWSSNWSNRIIGRIHDLERATANSLSCKSRNDVEATRVLNLAITAFAAQWTHTDRFLEENRETPKRLHEGHFDRSLQVSLWHQASRALSDAASNLSFKVIFAMIVFSLTQRPHDTATGRKTLTSMQDVLHSDSTPMFLEIALRQLHTIRRSLNHARHDRKQAFLGRGDKDTFDLLFWLAIMFDTLSAAMYQRPFVVKDDDSAVDRSDGYSNMTSSLCDLDGWNGVATHDGRIDQVHLWGDYFLRERSRSGHVRKNRLRWPCSYEDAATALCDAAPVKVLLFRRVGQLRDLACKPSPTSARSIETAIDAALDVYDHWSQSYGRFIADCIANHEELPARVQSWYILLAGHWQLAVFSLADAVDDADDAELGDPSHRRLRQISGFSAKLRDQSASMMAELGRCSRLSDRASSFSQSDEFHFAVNKAALLTEPWTAVLVQAFGRAGELLAHKWSNTGSSDARVQLQSCIDALEILGRKSDMALDAMRLLSKRLR